MTRPLTGPWIVERHREGSCRFDLVPRPYDPCHRAEMCNCCEPAEMATHRLCVRIGAAAVDFYICEKNAALMLREGEG